jgi:hypothetical protein
VGRSRREKVLVITDGQVWLVDILHTLHMVHCCYIVQNLWQHVAICLALIQVDSLFISCRKETTLSSG